MNPVRLRPFPGGLPLDGHKSESTRLPLLEAALPARLVFPLQGRHDSGLRPLVRPGERVRQGQPLTCGDDPRNPPVHASTSGSVRAIESLPLPCPSGSTGPCIVLDSDGEDEAVDYQGLADYRACPPEALRQRIHRAGIVGLGGAGFPTAVKADPHACIDTLILNGAECEPYISCDDTLLRRNPREVLEGARILRHLLGAQHCLVAVEADMPEALAALQAALNDATDIRIAAVPVLYPTGGERQLIRVLTGREVPSGGLPADIGVVCQNVATAQAVHAAVVHGRPLLERIVTVTGSGVRQPRNLLARIGTPIAGLIRQCGGYTNEAERLILGGPMMGFSLATDEVPLVKTANCILVAGRGEFGAGGETRPCIRCGACAEACPAGLLPQQLHWYGRAGQWQRVEEYRLAACIECGCCDLVCPSHIPLTRQFRTAKDKLAELERERQAADHARMRFEARRERLQKEQQERAEQARRRKENLDKIAAPEIRKAVERARAKRAGTVIDSGNDP